MSRNKLNSLSPAIHGGEYLLFKSPKSDVLILLATFLLTIFVDLTVAIEVGVVLAAFLFMKRMSEATQVGYITDSLSDQEKDEEDMVDQSRISQKDIPGEVEVFEINGPFFFGAVDKFKDTIRGLEKKPEVFILRMRHVPTIDHAISRARQMLQEKK